MELAGLVVNALVALGTLLLAVFAFLEIREGSRSRRAVELESDAQRVLDQEGGIFLRDLRFAVLRWRRNPELEAAMNHMKLRYEERIREFRDEMRKELNPLLIQFRQDMVSSFPEVDDRGMMVNDLTDPDNPNDWLSLRRFDELAGGAEVQLRTGEWHPDTIYDYPPGLRDRFDEDPAPESRMYEILIARYSRLISFERLHELPRLIPEQIDYDKVALDLIHRDIRLRLVDWKQRSPEFAAFQILVFVEALNPAATMDVDGDPTLPSLDPLRLHLGGFSGVYTSISYLDLVSHPEMLSQADNVFQSNVKLVVEALKQHLRDMVTGLQDEIKATSHPSTAILQALDRTVRWGGRHANRDAN